MSEGASYIGLERHIWAWIVGGVFSIFAVIIAFISIGLTLKWNSHPALRKNTVRILFMVPIYAVGAWLGLYQKEYTLYWDVLREVYEAFVIYSFYCFLYEYLNMRVGGLVLDGKDDQPHVFPAKYFLRTWKMGPDFMERCKVGILQYVPIKLLMAALTFILGELEVYHEGKFAWNVGYPYVAFITNASQIWAMYCLVLFYMAFKRELHDVRPVPKFLCIKAVVFFTFWQSVIIAMLVRVGTIQETETYTVEDAAGGLQDFVICIEMFLASLAHIYAFPHKEFHDPSIDHDRPFYGRMLTSLNPKDVVRDIHHMVARRKKGVQVIVEETEGFDGVQVVYRQVEDQPEVSVAHQNHPIPEMALQRESVSGPEPRISP